MYGIVNIGGGSGCSSSLYAETAETYDSTTGLYTDGVGAHWTLLAQNSSTTNPPAITFPSDPTRGVVMLTPIMSGLSFGVNKEPSPITFGEADFTVESWINVVSGTSYARFWEMNTASIVRNNSITLTRVGTNNVVNLYCGTYNESAGSTLFTSNNTAFTFNTWDHYALVYNHSAQTAKFYINGVLKISTTSTNVPLLARNIGIGVSLWQRNTSQSATSDCNISAYYSEFRISSMQRYTADFTPPTERFKRDANTIALLHLNPTLV